MDIANRTLTASIDHLTVFDITYDNWEEASLPSLHPFQVAPFTGAATYALDLWTPPGPGGLQPTLTLAYNSQLVDNANPTLTQASWVGMGWSLDTGAIERNQNGTPSSFGDDTFTLSLGGVDSLLLEMDDGSYRAANENFWKVAKNGDTWTVWDRQGTKYTFGGAGSGTLAQYGYGGYCDEDGIGHVSIAKWRWALYQVTNPYGKSLTYSYDAPTQNHRLESCRVENATVDTTIAQYPLEIDYPDSPYSVFFDLADSERLDYRSEWSGQLKYTFHMRRYLDAVLIRNGGETIRKYDFVYYPFSTPVIFPGNLWGEGGYTLTLHKIVESDKDGAVLPETTFTYDAMHLVSADNGYGGTTTFDYEDHPWYEVGAPDNKATKTDACTNEVRNLEKGVGHAVCVSGSQDEMDLYAGNGAQIGSAYRWMTAFSLQPGRVYRLSARVSDHFGVDPTVNLSLWNGEGSSYTLAVSQVVTTSTYVEIAGYAELPVEAENSYMLIDCAACRVEWVKLEMLVNRYRVLSQTLSDGVAGTADMVTSYRYDEPASNDTAHSAWAGTDNPYFPPSTEYRGHAMVQATGPGGRVQTTFFYQDDQKRGRPVVEIAGSQEYQTGFDDFGGWNGCPTAGVCTLERVRGDPALTLFSSGAWMTRERSASGLQHGDSVLTQFMVSGSAPTAVFGVYNGSWGQASYQRFGFIVNSDNSVNTSVYRSGAAQGAVQLFAAGTFKRDTWYVVQAAVDDQGRFLLRLWERDNPAVTRRFEYDYDFPAGLSWRSFVQAANGTMRLDTYSEGRIETLSDHYYGVRSWTEGIDPPANYDGLQIDFVYPAERRDFIFGGDASWLMKHTLHWYDETNGNRLKTLATNFNLALSRYDDFRLEVVDYYPNSSGGVHLVGLPARVSAYRCDGLINGACAGGYDDSRLTGQEHYLYDNRTTYNQAPLYGKPTGERTLLRFAGANFSDPRYRDVAYPTGSQDAWGNVLDRVAYAGEGTDGSYAQGDGRHTSSTYDTTYRAYVMAQTDAIGYTVQFTYNYDVGLPTGMTGPNGAATKIEVAYDGFGRVTQVIRPEDSTTYPTLKAAYNDLASPYWVKLEQRIDGARYAVQRKIYDGLGRLIQAQTADANLESGTKDVLTNFLYNAAGQLVEQTVPYEYATLGSGHPWRDWGFASPKATTTASYDALGRTTQMIDPDGELTTYGYFDLTTIVTDTLGNKTTTVADLWGRTVEVIPETGPGVTYGYDTLNRLLSAVRGGATTTLAYNLAGMKIDMADPDMGHWQYGYDVFGNLKEQTDARGCITNLSYDDIHRLTGKTYTGQCNTTVDISYEYDEANHGYGIGQRTSMQDASGQTSWIYDARGQVIAQTQVITGGLGTFVTAWGYNSAGLPAWMRYPADNQGNPGEQVFTTYHNQLSPNSVYRNLANEIYVTSTAYDTAGRVVERRMGDPGNLRTGYTYNPWTTQGGRLQRMIAGMSTGQLDSLLDLRYTYAPMGNITAIQDYKMGSPQTQAFTYDDVYRLTGAQATGGSGGNYAQESTTYDPTTGSLASKAGVSYTYADANHKHAVTSLSNGAAFTYDANGNMLTRQVGGQTFNLAYDAENRMISVSGALTNTLTYDYNADGARVIASNGITTTVFIGNYFEWTGTITDTVKYYYAGGVRVAMRKGSGEPLFLLSDHLGSTSKIVREDGTPLTPGGVQLYKAWGELRHQPDGELATKYRYTGQFEDGDIDLYWYGSRWYDPGLSRFLSPDSVVPLATQGTQALDRYAYANNDPLRYADPSGHRTCDSSNLDQCSMGGSLVSIEYQPWTKDEFSRWVDHVRHNFNKYAKDFGITFTNSRFGNWSSEQKSAILIAAMLTGSKILRSHPAYGTSSAAFNSVYSRGVDFRIGNCGLCPSNGGYSSNASLIQFDDLLTSDFFHGVNNVIHELGHIFDQITKETFGVAPHVRASTFFPNEQGLDVRISEQNTPKELFADTFLDWVIGKFARDLYGKARSSWMDKSIGGWLP